MVLSPSQHRESEVGYAKWSFHAASERLSVSGIFIDAPRRSSAIFLCEQHKTLNKCFAASHQEKSTTGAGLMMREHQVKKERLTIYLVKNAKLRDEQIVKVDRTKPAVSLKISSGSASLYVKDGPPPRIPAWTAFLVENQNVPEHLFLGSRSEAAVLIFRDADAAFALTFGMGFHLLNLDLMERDFGLRVTLNSIAPDKLRSLDKASYEANPLNTRNQSPKDADIFDLHIDTEMDMVYALTGASTEPMFGEHVTGRDALTIMPEARLDDLPEILAAAFARYKAKMPERFSWVDNVNRVREPDTLEILDLMLTDLLQADPPGENVWKTEERRVGKECKSRWSPYH